MGAESDIKQERDAASGFGAAVARLIPDFVTPNHISLGRIVGCLFIVGLEIAGSSAMVLAIVAFVVGTSDFFDGILARQRGQITRLGAVLDPLGDKLFFLAMLWVLWQRGWVEGYLILAILVLESQGLWLPLMCMARRALKRRALWPPPQAKPNWWGKWKMGWLGYAMGLIILARATGQGWLYSFAWWNLWVGLALGVVAASIYLWDFAHGEYQ
jgi:cardiolipin synthase